MANKPFELSEETKALVSYLRSLEKGATVTYAELSRVVGIRATPNHPKLIYARLLLQRDHNAVWVCVKPRVGLKRLNDVEIAERLPEWWLNGARSKLKRGIKQGDLVELDQLNIDQQAKFSVSYIQSELGLNSLSLATRRKMEKVSRGNSNDLPAFTAVEWAISLSRKKTD